MQKLYVAGSISMPVILLFYLYNRQGLDVHIVFFHILVLAALLSLAGLIMFLAMRRFIGAEESIIVMCLFWAGFWFFGEIRRSMFPNMSGTVLVMLIATVLALVVVLVKFKLPFKDFSPAFGTLSAVFVAMFFLNLAPAVYRNIAPVTSAENARGIISDISIRRDFIVVHSLPMPDIYWIHLDGMEIFWIISKKTSGTKLKSNYFPFWMQTAFAFMKT